MPANLENSAVATELEKVSFHSKPKERQCQRMLKLPIALISHASKVMLKILQARLQQYMNREIPDVQAGFRKGRGTRDQISNIRWIMEKAREFQRRARRDKKAFLNEQCKEIEENNRMGKTRAHFKKTGDIKGIFHARIDTIKDRNGKDLTGAETIK